MHGDSVLIPDYVSIVGSVVKGKKAPGDVDICIRKEKRDESLEVQLRNQLGRDIWERVHLIYNNTGPHSDFISLYDLVLRPKKQLKKTVIEQFAKGEDVKQREVRLIQEAESEALFNGRKPGTKVTAVYQHHWRGLTVDEKDNSEATLWAAAKHSVHGDLRFEIEPGGDLLGITMFVVKKNGTYKDKFMGYQDGDRIQSVIKGKSNKSWLNMSGIINPGDAGATVFTYARVTIMDRLSIEYGFQKSGFHEYFISNTDKIRNGRWLLMKAPLGGVEKWFFMHPKDQQPYKQNMSIDYLIANILRQEGLA